MAEDFLGPKEFIRRVSREDQSNSGQSRVFVGAPDFRVFVWGMDITPDVFSVTTTLTLDDNVSTATLNIVNDNEKWILPTALGVIPFDVFPDELSDRSINGDDGILGNLAPDTTSRRPGTYPSPMLFAKTKQARMKEFLSKTPDIQDRLVSQFQNSEHFPFLPGAPLFQAADRIRIFLKNPWGLQGGDNVEALAPEEWYFAFTGYIATVTEDFDATTNKSILRLYCEDIRRLLRYMRVTTNPNIFNLDQVTGEDLLVSVVERRGAKLPDLRQIAPDIVLFTGNASPLSGQNIVDRTSETSRNGFLEFMLMGAQETEQNVFGVKVRADGVLGFREGGKVIRTLVADGNFEKNISTSLDEIYPRLSEADVARYGADWSLGSDPDVRSVLNVEPNRLWVIIPDEAHFPNKRYPFDWQPRIDFFSEWRSRLDLINDFVKNLDCVWYATPKGDIVFEFPSYDAIPQRHSDPWRSIFSIENEFKGFSMTEDDRNIKTLTIAVGSPLDQIDLSRGLPFLLYAKVVNPELVVRYGLREQRSNRPFYYKEDSASTSIGSLARMWQELANSDAFRLEGLEALPNFRAVPGRPYFFKFRNLIAYAEMVQHQVVWGSLAQTVYGMKYVRHFDINTGTWRKISGNYGWNWSNDPKSSQVERNLDPLSHGADTVVSRKETDLVDPTAKILREHLQRDLLRKNLTDEQKNRLQEIVNTFSTQTVTPDERNRLRVEYRDIVSQASSKNG